MSGTIKDVGPGWANIVQPLIDKATEEGRKIYQIKEKFGGLRFYTDGASEELAKMIRDAELLSFKTCEYCGEPGEERDSGWIKTLCDKHHQERETNNGRLKMT